mmetsp:Transcript_27580/g.60247  ORF Transcript_27580/g.60247 Transcript_27580/m.60247 type:complete len:315 (-) Transcript_27580:172-1116(-)
MVGLVIETPLADDEVCTRVLALLHHVREVLLLRLPERLELLYGVNVHLVLGLGLRGLERASENGDLCVFDSLVHLRVANVLVEHDTVHQLRVFQLASHLGLNFDQIQIHILAFQVCDGEHGLHAHLRHGALAASNNLGRKGGHASLHEGLEVVLGVIERLRDLLQPCRGNLARHLVTFRNAKGMHATVKQGLCLLEQGPRDNHHPGGAVPYLVILATRQLHKKLGDLIFHIHLLQNGRSIVCDANVAVPALQHLVHPLRAKGRPQDARNSLCRCDVLLLCRNAFDPGLCPLLLDNDERPAILVESERHGAGVGL